jgi:hypothetical protein
MTIPDSLAYTAKAEKWLERAEDENIADEVAQVCAAIAQVYATLALVAVAKEQ